MTCGMTCRFAQPVASGEPGRVPWCETCSRFYNPSALAPDGTCTTCGAFIADPADDDESSKIPWHFWVLVVALVIYLGWRAVQGIAWLVHHFS